MKEIFLTFFMLLILSQGFSPQRDWSSVQNVVDDYFMNGAFPGAVLRVSNRTDTIYTYEVGSLTEKSRVPFTQDTIFDIASLTKVSATLSSVMHLYETGRFAIEDLVVKYIPEFNNQGKGKITIQNLLLHNAGLPADHPDPAHASKTEILDWIFNCQLEYPIATKMVYSDLSFILLGLIVERLTDQSLDEYAGSWFRHMGIYNSEFLPSQDKVYNIAPTEFSRNRLFISEFRKRLIRGEVHDPTAYSFGGVAGHAGFFSKASDLETYMQIHLGKGKHPNGTQIYEEDTVKLFYTRVDDLAYPNRRALGWDTVPIQDHPPCGHLFSLNSFGHTGYTGTMMWADRDKGIIVVLLTNRVHPTSLNRDIIAARSDIVDKIVEVYMGDD